MTTHHEISAFITSYVDIASRAALGVLRQEEPETAAVITRILAAENAVKPLEDMTPAERAGQKQAFQSLYEDLAQKPEFFTRAMQVYGKLNDLRRGGKKEAYHKAVFSLQSVMPSTADQFSYTLSTFAEQGVEAKHVQRYLDELRARFSITPHPTNGTTLEHTKQGITLENAMGQENTELDELKYAFKNYLKGDLVGAKKSVAEEVEEGIAVLNNLYLANLEVFATLEEVLDTTGYKAKGVSIRAPILEVEGWYAGDGDGNPNATAETLKAAFSRLQSAIKGHYSKDLHSLTHENPAAKGAVEKLLNSLESLEGDEGAAILRNQIGELNKAFPDLAPKLRLLDFQVATFGLHFSRLDIRHDSASLAATVKELAEAISEPMPEESGARVKKLSHWLKDAAALQKLSEAARALSQAETTSYETARILQRLMVVAKAPFMSAKLIIAEAATAEDALNALLVLKVTGHVVAEPGARMNIVPLAESINDLANLENAVKDLLADPVYRAHAKALGWQIVMVAESDNRRRDGFSAGEKINETIGRLIKLSDDVDLPISVMNGGGASQMRGAQKRATEIGFAQAYEAKKWNAHNLYQPLFTVQGHQARLLFSPLSVASYMVEGILSQNIYAKAGMEAQIEASTMTPDKKRRQDIARHDEQLFNKRARAAFRNLSADPSIDHLLEFAPWVSVIAGNASSRPSKRGGKDQLEGTPAREFIYQPDGKPTRALDQRAITGDNLARSFGILPLPFVGQKEGFEAMLNEGRAGTSHLGSAREAYTNTFDNSKPFRDHARSLAITLALTNFDKAWFIVAGERPSDAEVVALAQQYEEEENTLKPAIQTLAFLEVYASDTAKLLYLHLSGRLPVAKGAFYAPHAVLRAFWPELAWHIERRQRQLGFANHVEAVFTRKFNKELDNPVDAATYRLVQATQASVALNNTPIGMIATFTAKDRINEPTWGEAAAREEIRKALTPSKALAALANGQDLPGAEEALSKDQALAKRLPF